MYLPIDLYMLRHAESEGNAARRRSHEGDHGAFTDAFVRRHGATWRLTPRGRAQARATGEWLRATVSSAFDAYLVSPFARTMETAGLLDLPDARWDLALELRERDWGEMGPLSIAERYAEFERSMAQRETAPLFWRPPNGESLAEVHARLDHLLARLRRPTPLARVLLVSHGEVIASLRARLSPADLESWVTARRGDVPDQYIETCQVLHFTRRNPDTGAIDPHYGWSRTVWPSGGQLAWSQWCALAIAPRSSDALIALADATWPE